MTQLVPEDHWLRPSRILGLVAGRAIYRLSAYGAGIALLAIWGDQTFARFAAPIGATGWVLTVVGGTEKAAQTLLPRQPRRELERFFVLAAVIPYATLVLAWLVATLALPDSTAGTYAAGAAIACGVGGTSAMVALFRMRGRPGLDVLTYLHLSVGYVLGVVAVGWLDLEVRELFAVLVVWQSSAVLLLASRFRREQLGRGSTRAQRWEAVRVIPLLSAGDLASAVGASILYIELTRAPDARVLSTFYVAAVLLTVAAMVWTYLLRLFQPGLVRRLVAGHGARAVQFARRVAAVAGLAGLLITSILAATVWVMGDSLVLVAVLVVVEPLLYIGASLSTFVLENIGPAARRLAAAAAVPELVTVVVVGAVLAPYRGATGALVAICAGQTAKAVAVFKALGSVDPGEKSTAQPLAAAEPATREVMP
jgi:hypothetical protein